MTMTPELNQLKVEPRLWIDGAWTDGSSAITVTNPATGVSLAEVQRGSADDLRRAIDGAQRVFASWSSTPAATRGEILKRASALITARRNTLAALLTREQGKPLAQALGEVDYAASFFQWFGEEARRLCGRIQPHPTPGFEYLVQPFPAGVRGQESRRGSRSRLHRGVETCGVDAAHRSGIGSAACRSRFASRRVADCHGTRPSSG
jgi:hypothetical protein